MSIVYSIINVLIFLLLAPLFEGIIRKITARVQSRQGPPITQPYYDIIKLLGKNSINSTGHWSFNIAPLMAFASIIAVVSLIPFGYRENAVGPYADIITIIYLLTLGGVAVLLGAISSKNTFAIMGASREMATMVMVEPVLAMTLIMGAVKTSSLGIFPTVYNLNQTGYSYSLVAMLVIYILALQAFVGRQPFDIAEAEIEILEGPFIEFSGPNYALFKYYMMMKQMFYAFLFVSIFVPYVNTGYYIADMALQLVEMVLVFVVIALVGSTNPRLRIDQAVKYYAVLIVMSLCVIGLSVSGL